MCYNNRGSPQTLLTTCILPSRLESHPQSMNEYSYFPSNSYNLMNMHIPLDSHQAFMILYISEYQFLSYTKQRRSSALERDNDGGSKPERADALSGC